MKLPDGHEEGEDANPKKPELELFEAGTKERNAIVMIKTRAKTDRNLGILYI